MTQINYDALAADYAANRSVYPCLVLPLVSAARQPTVQEVLEVGCGTANYLGAITAAAGRAGWGIDPSAQMLAVAGTRYPALRLCQSRAEALPFAPGRFDLVFTVDVIHHVPYADLYFGEAYRLLARGGLICTATDSERIIATRQPLAVYWPETVASELQRYHPISRLRDWMAASGFTAVREELVEHHYALTSIQAYRDRVFSALRLISEDAWRGGLARMERDLAQGPIACVARYVLLWGTKP
jgi:ubiquinone/menaquinone biosynthesis C-methylase UbiE